MSRLSGLYVIIDPSACAGRRPVDVARAALDGGASMLQWRDKLRDKGEQLDEADEVFDLCRRRGANFILNDHADMALVLLTSLGRVPGLGSTGRLQATALLGVHLGRQDLPVAGVRRIIPPRSIVGASTNNVEEARAAEREGADYIAVGDIFGTGSKQGTRSASPARLAEVKRAVSRPVFGIGGIDAGNVAKVMAAGADGVAVISAVCAADDPRSAAARLVELIEKHRVV